MRFLVTGGAGFIGSNLVLTLLKMGEVVVLDNHASSDIRNLESFSGDVIIANVQDPGWESSVGKVDAIFHQAALTDTTVLETRFHIEVNAEGLQWVLRFAKNSGVRHVVYASSAGVYGNGQCPMKEDQILYPHNPYGFSKVVADSIADNFGQEHPEMVIVGLRYFNVYGPKEAHKGIARSMVLQLSEQMKSGKCPRIFKQGEQARDFIYVKDVIDANLKALEATSSFTVNVGTGKATSFNQVIEILNNALGTDYKPEYFDNPYSGYQNLTQAHTMKAKKLLGFEAKFSPEEGIRDYMNELKTMSNAST